jgi:DNA invertase Pin-like site-specific DNA recombinase
MHMKIGYARVSTTDQSLDLQEQKLTEAGCEKIFKEKVSGRNAKRKELETLLEFVREGDQVVITRLDRLARSIFDLQSIVNVVEGRKASLSILNQDIDTSTSTGKLLFNMLGMVAEFERDLISERAEEGRIAAKKRGVRFGQPQKLTPSKIKEIKALEKRGLTKLEIAKIAEVSRSSVYTALREDS